MKAWGLLTYPAAGVAHIAGYNDGVAVAPAIPTSSSVGVDSSGSQLLLLLEFRVSPATAPAFPFSLLGEGFLSWSDKMTDPFRQDQHDYKLIIEL